MSVLYVGTDTLESDASANATLALYRIATGASFFAVATLTRGNDTWFAARSAPRTRTVRHICARRRKLLSRIPYTVRTALFTNPMETAVTPYRSAAAAPVAALAGRGGRGDIIRGAAAAAAEWAGR